MGLFSAIGNFIGGGKAKKAAGQAANAQVAAAQQGVDAISAQQQAGANTILEQLGLGTGAINAQQGQTASALQPYMGAGAAATGSLQDLLGIGGDFLNYVYSNPDLAAAYAADSQGLTAQQWGQKHYLESGQYEGRQLPGGGQAGAQERAIAGLQDSPLFKALFGAGEDAIMGNASATGGLRGGNTQRSLADFGSDTLAKVIQQQLSNLSGVSGQGLSATGQYGTFGANAAGSVANLGAGAAGNIANLGANSASAIASLFGNQGAAQAQGILGKAQGSAAQTGAIFQGIGDVASAFIPGGGSMGKIASALF